MSRVEFLQSRLTEVIVKAVMEVLVKRVLDALEANPHLMKELSGQSTRTKKEVFDELLEKMKDE